jgi:hypothetical protein
MNAPITLAQVSSKEGTSILHVIKLVKPADGHAVTVKTGYEGKIRIDFSGIADERISIVRVGETAVIYFHGNKSTITLDPFFGSNQWPLANLEFELGPNRVFGAQDIAALLPFTVYQGILPAADGQAANEQDAGANFNPAVVADLPPIILNELMPPEVLPPVDFRADVGPALAFGPLVFAGFRGIVEEDHLSKHGDLPGLYPFLSEGNEGPTSFNHGTGVEDDFDNNPDTIDGDDDTWFDTDNTTHQFKGQIEVTGGSGSYSFALLAGWTPSQVLESKGQELSYGYIGGVLVGYVDNGAPGPSTADRVVFTLELSPTGEVTFTIYDQLDHLSLNGLPGDNEENNLDIDFSGLIEVTDNGGSQVLVIDNVEMTVIDDVPVLTQKKDFHVVDEDDIKTLLSHGTSPNDGDGDGSYTGNPNSNGPGPATVSGNLQDVVRVGTDEHKHYKAKFSFLTGEEATQALGQLSGLGLSSKGEDLSYFIQNGVLYGYVNGQGSPETPFGPTDRIVFTLTLGSDGDYAFRLYDQLDHDQPHDDWNDGDGNSDENFDLEDSDPDSDVFFIDFGSLIQASDFDEDRVIIDGKLKIAIRDDVPEVRDCDPIVIKVNEDDIKTGDRTPNGSFGTSPNDGNGDGSYTGDPDSNGWGPATVFGSLTGPNGVVISGADEPLTFSFADNTTSSLNSLGLKSKGGNIRYEIQDGTLFAYVNNDGIQSYDPQADRLVFEFSVDPQTGEFAFKLWDQVDHDHPYDDAGDLPQIPGDQYPDADQNHDLRNASSQDDVSAIDFGQYIDVTDYDGDSVNLDGKVIIKIIDDIPEVKCGEKVWGVVEEEHIKPEGNEDFNAAWPDLDFDHWQPGDDYNDTTTVAFGNSQNSQSLTSLIKVGADEKGAFAIKDGVCEGDKIRDKDGHVLQSKDKDVKITDINKDYHDGKLVKTTIEARATDGRLIFTLTIEADGDWKFQLFDQIDHHPNYLADDEEGLLILDFSDLVEFTDFDGDSVCLEDCSFLVKIIDDIPVADIKIDTHGKLIHDETPNDDQGPDDVDFNELPSGVRNAFNGVTNRGNDPDVGDDNGAIGYAHDNSLIGVSSDNSVGADQPGDSASFALAIVNADSGLFTTEGQPITLYLENGMIVGRIPATGQEALGKAVFAIHIEDDGDISVAQWLSIRHDDVNDHDEDDDNGNSSGDDGPVNETPNPVQQSLDGKIKVILTVEDEDGDVATDEAMIGHKIIFEDDGPKVFSNNKVQLEDDDLTPNGNDDTSSPGDDSAPQNTSGTLGHSYGSDGPGTTGGIKLTGVDLPGGLGFTKVLSQDGLTLDIYQNNVKVLTITLADATSGDYTVVQHAPIDHPSLNNQSGDNTENNVEFEVEYRVTDGDGDYSDGELKINVDDDMPKPSFTVFSGTIIHDETSGDDADANDTDTNLSALFPAATVIPGNDPHVNNALEPAIGYAQTSGPVIAVTANVGADVPSTVTYSVDINGSSLTNTGLSTTEGKQIWLFEIPGNPNLLVGRYEDDNNTTPDADDPAAFAIHVDPATGVMTLVQYVSIKHDDAPIDHDEADDASDGNLSTVLQSLPDSAVRVTVTVTDHDGDSVTKQENIGNQISFQDDGPAIISITKDSGYGPDLIENGSFTASGDFANDENNWGDPYGAYDSNGIEGWNVAWSPLGGGSASDELRVERKGIDYLGMNAGNVAMVDMAASPGNIQLSQTLSGLTEGQAYTLEFMAGSPAPSSAKLVVLWNGDVVDTIEPGASMVSYKYVLIAGDGPNELVFREIGTNSTNVQPEAIPGTHGHHGTYLASVSLKASYTHILDDEDTTLNPAVEIQGGPGDDGNGLVASGKINFNAGADGLKSIVIGGIPNLSAIWVDGNGVGHPESVSYQWVADGSGGGTLYGLTTHFNTQGNPAFKISVDADGNYAFTLTAPLNHPLTDNPDTDETEASWEDNLQFNFPFTITDGDDDTASGTLCINIDDDSPEFVFNSATQALGIEDGEVTSLDVDVTKNLNLVFGADGEHATNGAKITAWPDLPGVTETLSADGKTLTATIDGTNGGGPDDVLYTLALNGDGTYTFTQVNNLPGGFSVLPTVTLGDGFGPIATRDYEGFTLNGLGGGLLNGSGAGVGVNDNNMNVSDQFQIVFDGAMESATLGINFAGNGTLKLHWIARDAAGNILEQGDTAAFGADGSIDIDPSVDFFKLDLQVLLVSGPNESSPKFKLTSIGGESEGDLSIESLTFQVTGMDGDGDAVSDTFDVEINVDTPFTNAGSFSGIVEEEHLNNGNSTLPNVDGSFGNEDTTSSPDGVTTIEFDNNPGTVDGDDDGDGDQQGFNGTTDVTTGTLTISGGDGGNVFSFNVANGTAANFLEGGQITSKGQLVYFVRDTGNPNILYGVANGGGASDAIDNLADRKVFQIVLTPGTGQFVFTLLDQLDHHPSNSADNVEANKTVDLGGVFIVDDSDSDSSDKHVFQNISVKVIDDIPVAQSRGPSFLQVQEDSLGFDAGDNSIGIEENPSDSDQDSFSRSVILNHVNIGADEHATVSFNAAISGNVKDAGGNSVTSRGAAVLWAYDAVNDDVVGYVDTGAAGFDGTDPVIFRITESGGNITLDLEDQIDHGPGVNNDDEASIGLQIGAAFVVTDADGDSLVLSASAVRANVENDIPIANLTSIAVDEDDLVAGGNTPFNGSSDALAAQGDNLPDPSLTVFGGTLNGTVGADEPGTFSWNGITGPVTDTGGNPLSSDGLPLVWVVFANTIYATTQTGPNLSDVAANAAFYIQITNTQTGAYQFTLQKQLDHPGHDNPATNDGNANTTTDIETAFEDNLLINIGYTLTDYDGETANGTVQVNIDDDIPTLNIVDASPTEVVEGTTANGTWSFSSGADGSGGFTVVSEGGTTTGPLPISQPPAAGQPLYLTINADGTWSIQLIDYDAAVAQYGPSFTFTIKHKDGDGDEVSDTHTVTLIDGNDTPEITVAPEHVSVDEDGFGNANLDGFPISGLETDANESLVTTGTVTIGFGGDVPADLLAAFDFSTVGLNGQLVSLNDGPVTFALVGNDLVGSAGGNEVIRIEVTNAADNGGGSVTYTYQVTLSEPLKHVFNDNEDSQLLDDVQFTVTDDNGDPVNGSFDVTVIDDIPVTQADSALLMVGDGEDFNVCLILDYSGSIDNTELNTMLSAVKTAGGLFFNGTSGEVSITVVCFASEATTLGTFTSLAAFEAAIDATNPSEGGTRPAALGVINGTDYTAALEEAMDEFTKAPDVNNQVFFISDGDPNQQTNFPTSPMLPATVTAWNAFVNTGTTLQVTSIGIGVVSAANLQAVDVDGTGAPINIANFDDLVDTLVEVINVNDTTGNVIRGNDNAVGGGDDDGYGADGPGYVSYLHIDADGDGNVDANEDVYTFNGTGYSLNGGAVQAGNSVTFDTPDDGEMTFNFATGAWEYTTPDTVSTQITENFNYKIKDGDGDESAATDLDITVHPLPTLAVAAASTSESSTHIEFTVSLSHGLSDGAIPVTFSTTAGTAAGGGTDFGAPIQWFNGTTWVSTPFSFAPGQTSVQVRVPLNNDTLDEADETFTLTATAANGTANGSVNNTGTIEDNDAPVTLSIDTPAAVQEGVNTTITFTVTKSALSGLTSTVVYTVNPATAGTPGDYTGTPTDTITFLPNETSKTITLTIVNDGFQGEPNETFTVTLSSPTNATISVDTGTGTIIDAEPNAAPIAVADLVLTNIVDGSPFTIPNAALLANDTDGDSDPLTVTNLGGATGGTVAPGVIFDPTLGVVSTVAQYRVTDVTTATVGNGGHRAGQFVATNDGDTPIGTLGAPTTFTANLTNTNYNSIEASNDSNAFQTTDPGENNNSVFWVEFDVDQGEANVTQIVARIEARQTGSPDANEGLDFGIYNYTLGQWEIISPEVGGTASDTVFTVTKSGANVGDYISSSGKVAIVLYNEDDNNSTQGILVDNVELDVTHNVPATFANGSFTYHANDGTIESAAAALVTIQGQNSSTITGTGAAEILVAGGNADTLLGNGGLDVFVGGAGSDTMTGGAQKDVYMWRTGDQGVTTTAPKTYNFVGVNSGNDLAFAHEFSVNTASFANLNALDPTLNTNYVAGSQNEITDYTQIATDNTTYWNPGDPGTNNNQAMRFQFFLTEDPAQATQIQINILAHRPDQAGGDDELVLGVWNYSTNDWQQFDIDDVNNTNTPVSLTATINSNLANYVGPNGELSMVLFNEDQDGSTTDGQIAVDYVEAIVSSPTGSVTDTITNFQFGGPNADVLNFDNLLPGGISNASPLGTLDDYFQFELVGGDTVIHVDHDGGGTFQPTMNVVLDNVDITAGGTLNTQQILQSLLDNSQLQV